MNLWFFRHSVQPILSVQVFISFNKLFRLANLYSLFHCQVLGGLFIGNKEVKKSLCLFELNMYIYFGRLYVVEIYILG
jgi:hypothetical protein